MARRFVLLLAAAFVIGGLVVGLSPATDAQDGGVEAERRGPGADRAESYINPDTGLPTENRSVNRNSGCPRPDQADGQKLSDPGSVNNNVHNDACLFRNMSRFDAPVSFESRGVGLFSACPDPDDAGPKTAVIVDGGKRCYQTGWQEKGIDGDTEYHARVNNDSRPGMQTVIFCHDPENNGCRDARVKDSVVVRWMR